MTWKARGSLLGRILRLAAAHPAEVLDRARNLFELKWASRIDAPPHPYQSDLDWEATLHNILAVPWPCQASLEFASLWREVRDSLEPEREWIDPAFDADIGLARAAWCLTRHLQPGRVVETGVARGVTSWIVLQGLERNQKGHLWSIDLPPLSWAARAGYAVPDVLRNRWTYVRGSSKSRLPPVLRQIGSLDLFIHDSLHTEGNLRFELSATWPSLSQCATILADDIDQNRGFSLFLEASTRGQVLIAPKETGRGLFGIIVKNPPSGTAA
jgi:hypothetical protein